MENGNGTSEIGRPLSCFDDGRADVFDFARERREAILFCWRRSRRLRAWREVIDTKSEVIHV